MLKLCQMCPMLQCVIKIPNIKYNISTFRIVSALIISIRKFDITLEDSELYLLKICFGSSLVCGTIRNASKHTKN